MYGVWVLNDVKQEESSRAKLMGVGREGGQASPSELAPSKLASDCQSSAFRVTHSNNCIKSTKAKGLLSGRLKTE